VKTSTHNVQRRPVWSSGMSTSWPIFKNRSMREGMAQYRWKEKSNVTSGETVLEVKEIIHLPLLGGHTASEDVELDSIVLDQLEDYVSAVASMYRDNRSSSMLLMWSCPSSSSCRVLSLLTLRRRDGQRWRRHFMITRTVSRPTP
jgi:hypothetical protein